jgi:cell division septation protein DedD
VDEPRTHYQISLTARQAVGLFVGLLLALGLAFFFGLMSGLSGRERAAPEPTPSRPERVALAPEPMPAVETAVPTVGSRGPSHTDLASGGAAQAAAAEPTIPPTIQTFEDGTADETAAATSVPGRPSAEAARPAPQAGKAPPPPATGKFWVQIASLTSREEAGALSGRLSRHGFHTVILSAAAPKGPGKVYRIRVGPYKSEEEAGRAATKLGKQEKIKSPWVVPEGK